MIIARLQGGLGNQLFQYAAAKALATKLNADFRLDAITSLKKDKLRKIAIDATRANYALATSKEIGHFIRFRTLYRHKPELVAKLGTNIYREPHFHFDKNFFNLTDPVFLDGFWQSPRYFESIEPEIRADFGIKTELVQPVAHKAENLSQANSVAVHIRRGDFLKPAAVKYHGVLSAEYYKQAIEYLSQKVSGATFHFFSDDMNWVRNNFKNIPNTFFDSMGQSAIEDFYLMSRCRHNIIANSSFSWWAAWLNANQEKKVIAPQNWFVDKGIDTSDLIPSDWKRL